MATSQKLTSHFLTCSVCLEVFTNPCTLPCDHTFCSKCVVTYTKTRPDAVSARSVPCPFCKRLTKVPDPDKPVEEWAGQFKPSLLLLGLMDTIGPGSKDTTNCNLCHEGGETTPATTWCSACDVSLCDACLKVHGRMPATRHHVTSDLSGEVKVKGRRRVMCQEHKDEYIKFYCKDCKKTLCQSCCIIYHRKCESVTSLESMLPEMRVVLEARKEALMKKIHKEEINLDSRKSPRDAIQQTKSSIQSQIRSTAQKATDAIKKKEKQLMDELDEITDKQMDQLKADIKSGDMAIQIYKQQSEFIDQALNSDSEVDMYDLYQSCESGAGESVGDTDMKEKGTKTRIEFSQDMDKMKKALDELQLGKIKVIHEGVLDTVSTPVLTDTIDCTTVGDTKTPSLYDIICMDVSGTDTLIVTDIANKCIKSFPRNSQSCRFRLGLQSKPWCITKLENNKLAVTLPYSSQIVTVTVTPDLSLLSSITTSKQYIGLTALTPTTLAAGSGSPPCVDILDMSGNVLQSISPLNNGQKIIQKPYFLCTTRKGNILVSDRGTKSVLCLTPQGDVVFNYSPTGDRALGYPAGITSTDTGDILVVDRGKHKVIQMSDTGQFVRDILTSRDGLSNPYCIHYDERGSIYIRHNKESIQIRSTAQKVMDAIKKKEKQLMNELDEITDKQMGQLKADIKSGDMAIQIYKQQSEFIDQALNSDSEVDMYDLYQSCESGAVESVGDTDVKGRGTRTRIEFSRDMDKMNKALDELQLGKIKVIHEGVLDTVSTPVLTDTIDCRTVDDMEKPILTDFICMDVSGTDTLIVTDSRNKCIKSFPRNSQSCHFRLGLQSKPGGITKLENNKLAITLPYSSQIVTVTVTPDLSLLSSITTSKQYWGLTVLTPTTLAAGSGSPPCVDILDMSGNVLQSISPLNNGQKIIKYPHFLCTTRKGNILVSDCGTKSVLCLTPQGDVVFNYSPAGDRPLRDLTGITSTDTGDILVVDRGEHKVIQMSETGQFVRDILTSRDGLSNPWRLHYDERGSIYVSHHNESIQVFTLT